MQRGRKRGEDTFGDDYSTLTLEEQAAIGQGHRHLLARILYQAVKDEKLGGRPRRGWPWENWHPRLELDAFWQSAWCASICEWLDLPHEKVLQLVEEARRNGN